MKTIALITIGFILIMALVLVVMFGIDNITTYFYVKSLKKEKIEDNINYYDNVINNFNENDDIRKLEIMLDHKELWEYYLKLKLKQMEKK